MVLVVAVGDADRLPAADLSSGGLRVATGEGDGRGVVVELVELDVELLYGADHDGRHQRSPVRIVKAVEGTADPVVIQAIDLVRPEAEQGWYERLRPFLESIDGPAPEDDVAKQDPEGGGGLDPEAPVVLRHILLEELVQAKAVQDVLDHRQGAK